ncbi:hypothetical protein [Variovorax paradoxus]|uniref:hypothetical protein n=1 Tax=Variovorax paradoxus TaxID=34073 RepID=UPI003ECEC181
MLADPKVLSAVRRVNLEASLLALLVEGMNVHGADTLEVRIALGDNHAPADIDISYIADGVPVAGESL